MRHLRHGVWSVEHDAPWSERDGDIRSCLSGGTHLPVGGLT